jgi:hypothetical protein
MTLQFLNLHNKLRGTRSFLKNLYTASYEITYFHGNQIFITVFITVPSLKSILS